MFALIGEVAVCIVGGIITGLVICGMAEGGFIGRSGKDKILHNYKHHHKKSSKINFRN